MATLVIALFFVPLADFSTVTPRIFLVVALSSILGATAFLLVSKAVRHMEVSTVSPMLVTEPGLVAILAFALLGEQLSGVQVSGIILLIIGT